MRPNSLIKITQYAVEEEIENLLIQIFFAVNSNIICKNIVYSTKD